MGEVKRLCPDVITLPYQFEDYRRTSQLLYDTVAGYFICFYIHFHVVYFRRSTLHWKYGELRCCSYTHDIEAVSCDELYANLTDLLADVGIEPLDFASLLRSKVTKVTGCPVSIGLGDWRTTRSIPNIYCLIYLISYEVRVSKQHNVFNETCANCVQGPTCCWHAWPRRKPNPTASFISPMTLPLRFWLKNRYRICRVCCCC